jgi:hypothetical protein
MGHAVPQGVSPQAALHDDRECRDRHRLDRAILAAIAPAKPPLVASPAALPLSHTGLLEPDRRSVSPRSGEPHSNRVGIRDRFHCHAMTYCSMTSRLPPYKTAAATGACRGAAETTPAAHLL